MAGTVRSEQYRLLLKALVGQRKQSGLSQAQLAARLGKPPSFVAKYELGERRLDVVETLVILNALGADPKAFLDEHVKHLPERL